MFTRIFVTLVALAALAACRDVDSPTDLPRRPAFSRAATTLELTGGATSLVLTTAGAAATMPLTLARPADFAGPVLLAVTAPVGVTAKVAPDTLAADQTAATLTVEAAPDAAAGELVITASGVGVVGTTLTVPYTIGGRYTVAVAPSTLTVVRDADADVSATVTLTRHGFAGGIRLVASGVPAGVTLAMPSAPLRGDAASLRVRAAASAEPGDYRVTLTATSDGLAPESTTLALRVVEGGAMFSIGMGRRPPGSPIVMVAGTELGEWDRPTVEIKRSCYECDVKLEATGAPNGITVTFAPSGGDRASNPAVLTRYNGWAEPRIAVAADVRDGDYPITLTATAGDNPPVSTTLVVRVVAAGYSVTTTPATTVVAAGGGPVSVALRALPASGFDDRQRDLKIATSGVPAGITLGLDAYHYLGLDPGDPLHFTVRAAASVAPGDYRITIHSVVNDAKPTPVDTSADAAGTLRTTFVVRVISPSEDHGFVPAELAGSFRAGALSLLEFWDTHTGAYEGRNGYTVFFRFAQDGTYQLLVYTLQRGYNGCSTEVWSEYGGPVTFAERTFELRPTSGRYKVADSCYGHFYERVASSEDLEANSRTFYWAWERNAEDGKTYLRVGFDLDSRDDWNWFARTDDP
jgi:hypothetical protein